MRRTLLVLLAVLALTAAACGDSDDESAKPTAESPATTAAATDAGSGPTLELIGKDIAFDKTKLTASAGSVSIRFDNQDDGIAHNLRVSGNAVDDKTEIEEGPVTQTLELELEAGSYTYVCDVHPQEMRGELTVI